MQTKDSSELEDISQKLYSLLNYKAGMIKEIKDLHVRRRDLRVEMRSLSERIKETRETLNKGYQVFKDTRETRSENLSKIREIRLKIQVAEDELKKVERNLPQRGDDNIAERLRAADWKLQTEKITREEEKQLVEMIRDLESRLQLWKKAYAARQEISNLRSEMSQLKKNLDNISMSRGEAEAEHEAGKDRLVSDMKTREQLFKEMEDLNEDIIELENTIAKTDEQINEMKEKRRSLVNEERNRDLESLKSREKEMLTKAKDEAKEKLLKGEKLTFSELKLAFDEEFE